MKTVILILALIVSTAAPGLWAANDETFQARNAQYKQLQQQIND